MINISIPYYSIIKGRGYWRPSKLMKSHGFHDVPCGRDGPDAWRVAAEYNLRWQRVRRGETAAPNAVIVATMKPEDAEELVAYPRGSIGEAFSRYRKTVQWSHEKKPRTREDWWRGWRRIRPVFGDIDPKSVTLENISEWRKAIEDTVSLREAHRSIKIWRALWKVAAAMKFCSRDADPSLAVRNRAAKGRRQTWSEGEAVRLIKTAWRMGYRGLAAALAVMWDSQLSPGDVRSLRADQLSLLTTGGLITERGKTGKPVGGILSRRTSALLRAYLAALPATPVGDAHIFLTRGFSGGAKGGQPKPPSPYSKDNFARDFRFIRESVFGVTDDRKMLDFRRSGAVEAITGGATPQHLSHAMGNTLSASNQLFETYVPVQIESIRDVTAARKIGRRKLRKKNE